MLLWAALGVYLFIWAIRSAGPWGRRLGAGRRAERIRSLRSGRRGGAGWAAPARRRGVAQSESRSLRSGRQGASCSRRLTLALSGAALGMAMMSSCSGLAPGGLGIFVDRVAATRDWRETLRANLAVGILCGRRSRHQTFCRAAGLVFCLPGCAGTMSGINPSMWPWGWAAPSTSLRQGRGVTRLCLPAPDGAGLPAAHRYPGATSHLPRSAGRAWGGGGPPVVRRGHRLPRRGGSWAAALLAGLLALALWPPWPRTLWWPAAR